MAFMLRTETPIRDSSSPFRTGEMTVKSIFTFGQAFALALLASASFAVAQDDAKKTTTIELADGKVTLVAPEEWKKVQPRSNIIEYEFAAPKDVVDDKDKVCRVTVMGAGGSIKDNIDRWYAQFEQPDGTATKDKSKSEVMDVAGQKIHYVDIPGTFKDSMGGPFFQNKPPVLRENYRMLGAIIETKGMGTHFFKVTGPSDSIEKLSEGFKKMLKEMKVKS